MSSEHEEQTALFNILALYEDKYPILKWVFAIPNGGKRHPATAVKMKAEGVKAGVWDIFVPVVQYDDLGGCCGGLYIEMKYGKNTLTDNQRDFRNAVGESYDWAICYTAEEAAREIGDYLGIEELKTVE